ncbi:MAG: DNA adenine methylase [Pseudolabrys sp.]
MDSRVTYRPVEPVKPAAGYIGGKKQLAKRLVDLIDATPHETYAEPFVGMGGVFFRRRRAPKGEIINDRSGDVATFFRVLQRHYVPFLDMLRWQLTGRREFERLKECDPSTLTDLERAARFLYLQRTAFGGKVAGRNFGVDAAGARFNITKLVPMLEDLHERLAGVVIECLRWQDFVARYDRPATLFFLDPPYYGSEGDYGRAMFDRTEFEELATVLKGLKGRFILTLNDVPEVRRIFAGFKLTKASVTYTVSGSKPRRSGELIITSVGRRR